MGLVCMGVREMQTQDINTIILSHQRVRIVILVQACEFDILYALILVSPVIATELDPR